MIAVVTLRAGAEMLLRGATGDQPRQVVELLRIAVDAVCPLATLLPTLKAIDENHATHLIVSSEMLAGAIERLNAGDVDMAITLHSEAVSELLESFPLMAVTIVPVAHRDHPAARQQGLLSETTMRAYNQIIVADSSSNQKQSLNVLQGGKKWVVSDIATKKDIILAGMGWGGLPAYFIADELARGELVRLEVAGFQALHYHLAVVRRTDRPRGMVHQALWSALEELARQQPS